MKAVLELFEVSLCLCVTRSHVEPKTPSVPKGLPDLERYQSKLDEVSSEALLKQAFRVIF